MPQLPMSLQDGRRLTSGDLGYVGRTCSAFDADMAAS